MNAKIRELSRLLRKREASVKSVCAAVPVSYTNFSAVLAGRRSGAHTWRKLRQYFTDEERAVIAAEYGDVFSTPAEREINAILGPGAGAEDKEELLAATE